MSGKFNLDPVNFTSPVASNPGPPVVPSSMAGEVKPDTANLPPPGHARDEVLRERKENLEAAIDKLPERGGVDVSTIPIEREIVQAFDGLGNLTVTGAMSGWVYKWKKADDQQTTLAQNLGFELVQGNDPEAQEHKGKHCAGGTTLRGAGDVLLWRIKQERWEAIEDYFRRKGFNMGQVTERFEDYGAELAAQGLTPKNLAHGRASDPLVQRVFANGPIQSARMGEMLRSGSVPGASAEQIFRR